MVARDASTRTLAGRYRLGPTLGTGAHAKSFDAIDLTDGSPVVVKMLPSHFGASASFMERFNLDLKVAAELDHPNIVRVLHFGVERVGAKDYPFVVTAQLPGGSLRGILDRGRTITASQALMIGLDVCRGLAHAHSRGLVHGAITPSNILFGPDRKVQIADFGISRILGDLVWSNPGRVDVDVARYASPEQALGVAVEPRSDVYCLALTLVESVTGVVPFSADTSVATLTARLDKLMPVSADLGALASVLERAGRPALEDRFTAVEFGRALVVAAEKMPRPEPVAVVGLGRFGEASATLIDVVEPQPDITGPTDTGGMDVTGAIAKVRPDAAAPAAVPETDPMASLRSLPDAAGVREVAPMPAVQQAPDSALAPGSWAPSPPSVPAGWEEVTTGSRRAGEPAAEPVAGGSSDTLPLGETAADWAPEPTVVQRTTTIETVEGDDDVLDIDRRSMTKYVLAALGLLLAAVLGVIGYRALSAPSHTVPNLIGVTEAQATNLVGSNGWKLDVRRLRDDGQAQGDIVSTDPAAGERLKKGSTLVLVVSDGPTLSVIPDVTGFDVDTARSKLTQLGLTMREAQQQASETVPAGSIISWSVPEQPTLTAGSQVPKGTTVEVVVSSGSSSRTVPDLTGLTVEDATARLDELGLVAGTPTETFSLTVESGRIVSTDPAAGTSTSLGATVNLVVSKGKDLVVMPKVVGKTLQEATDALTKAGFVVGSVSGGVDGTVAWASYSPGDRAVRGTSVALVMLAPEPTTTTSSVPAPN